MRILFLHGWHSIPGGVKRGAMEEVSRTFPHGNVKVDFDHYKFVYRCSAYDQRQEQEEHVFPNE